MSSYVTSEGICSEPAYLSAEDAVTAAVVSVSGVYVMLPATKSSAFDIWQKKDNAAIDINNFIWHIIGALIVGLSLAVKIWAAKLMILLETGNFLADKPARCMYVLVAIWTILVDISQRVAFGG